jgi:hypothetical protein
MIGKIERQPATEYVQIERSIKEPGPQIKEDPVYQSPSRESAEQTANARKNEMAITSSTQKSFLESQIPALSKSKAPVAAKEPVPIADASNPQTLKLGDKTEEVNYLVGNLNNWERANGLKETPFTNGVYTEEVERAVRQFQIANNMQPTGKVDSNTRNRITLENDPHFRVLDSEVKQNIRSAMDIHADRSENQKNIMSLATDRQFAHLLSKDSQIAAVNSLLMHPEDKNHLNRVKDTVLDVAILEKEKTLDHLPESTKRQVITTLFKKTEDQPDPNLYFDSGRMRETIIELAKNPEFARLNESQQKKLLDAVAANPFLTTASSMNSILNSKTYKNMDEKMKAHVVELAAENAMYPVLYGKPMKDDYNEKLSEFSHLMYRDEFIKASQDDKWAQLNAFKTSPPNPNHEVNIL